MPSSTVALCPPLTRPCHAMPRVRPSSALRHRRRRRGRGWLNSEENHPQVSTHPHLSFSLQEQYKYIVIFCEMRGVR